MSRDKQPVNDVMLIITPVSQLVEHRTVMPMSLKIYIQLRIEEKNPSPGSVLSLQRHSGGCWCGIREGRHVLPVTAVDRHRFYACKAATDFPVVLNEIISTMK